MAEDIKAFLASPEFASAPADQRIKMLSERSPAFAALDPAGQQRYLSTLSSKIRAATPQGQAAREAGQSVVRSNVLGTVLGAGLPIGGSALGGALAARQGMGPIASAALRTAGAGAGGALSGAITGEPGLVNITGSPAADQAIIATIAQAVPELAAGAILKGASTAKATAGAKALTQYEDAAAAKIAGKVQDAVPWWTGQFSKDHAGLTDMVYVKGPELLQQGYQDAMTKIGPLVKGQPILIDVRAAQRLGIETKALVRQPGPAMGAPDEVVADMGLVISKLPALREKDPSAYAYIVRNVDRYLADITHLPSEFKAARKAYAEGRGFIDGMQKSGAIDPLERRFRADKFAENLVKKDVLNQQVPRGRAPVTRQTMQEVAPYNVPAPQRGEIGVKIPGFSRRLGGESRIFESGPIGRIPTAKNIPGRSSDVRPSISRGLPFAAGGLGQIAREAMTPRRRRSGEE